MNWRRQSHHEPTAHLCKDRTLRTICPTKSVTAHGIRFSYVLAPPAVREDLRYAYANSAGSGSIFDRAAAHQIMSILNSPESNGALLRYIQARYDRCIQEEVFRDSLGAESTYFTFVQMNRDPDTLIAMDEQFFDTNGFDGFVRFNLLLRNLDRVVRLPPPNE
jgi:hypothetical protein